jgi:hypothetical protein
MTDYENIYTKKRTFVVRATLPNLSQTLATIYYPDSYLIDRNGDFIIDRNDDFIICRDSVFGRPRSIRTKKRNFIIRAQVG